MIADSVAEGVIDVLEPIQIDKQQGKAGLTALGDGLHLAEAVIEQKAVGQSGQKVVMGHVLDAGFIGDVLGLSVEEGADLLPRLGFDPSAIQAARAAALSKVTCRSLCVLFVMGLPLHKISFFYRIVFIYALAYNPG